METFFLQLELSLSPIVLQFQDHIKYAGFLTSFGPVELSVHFVHEEMTRTYTNRSSAASNILPFSKFLTLEPDVHKNRQL